MNRIIIENNQKDTDLEFINELVSADNFNEMSNKEIINFFRKTTRESVKTILEKANL